MTPSRFTVTPSSATAVVVDALLVTGYAILAVAATARSAVQVGTRWDDAPVAYALSSAAALTYLAVSWALRTRHRRMTVAACVIELTGVLVVGTWSVASPEAFPDQTVWSGYGVGYGCAPLLLPAVTLWWLHRRDQGPNAPELR
ncbi:MAG: hypothetical protein ACRCXL_07605 [Dermatophilaceae bacterium]